MNIATQWREGHTQRPTPARTQLRPQIERFGHVPFHSAHVPFVLNPGTNKLRTISHQNRVLLTAAFVCEQQLLRKTIMFLCKKAVDAL